MDPGPFRIRPCGPSTWGCTINVRFSQEVLHVTEIDARTAELEVRNAVLSAIDKHPSLDLSLRLRRELRRTADKHTHDRKRRDSFVRSAIEWCDYHLVPALDNPATFLRAEDVFAAFLADYPQFKGQFGKRLFYDVLRDEGFDIDKMSVCGRRGAGPLMVIGVELQA